MQGGAARAQYGFSLDPLGSVGMAVSAWMRRNAPRGAGLLDPIEGVASDRALR
jgi:hypothetical protein